MPDTHVIANSDQWQSVAVIDQWQSVAVIDQWQSVAVIVIPQPDANGE